MPYKFKVDNLRLQRQQKFLNNNIYVGNANLRFSCASFTLMSKHGSKNECVGVSKKELCVLEKDYNVDSHYFIVNSVNYE